MKTSDKVKKVLLTLTDNDQSIIIIREYFDVIADVMHLWKLFDDNDNWRHGLEDKINNWNGLDMIIHEIKIHRGTIMVFLVNNVDN